MAQDELIDRASVIVLVQLQRTKLGRYPDNKIYILKTVETIKGAGAQAYSFDTHEATPSDNDFDLHQQRMFWESDVGRSRWPGGSCGPAHAFRSGRMYLYFPDKLGAIKSAEIVASDSDRWLKYVRQRVADKARDRRRSINAYSN